MIKLEEGLVGDYRADWTKPGPKSVFKQSSQLLKKETVLFAQILKKENGSVHPIYVNTVMFVSLGLGQCWENYHRKVSDNSASNKCYLLCIYYYKNFVYIIYFVFRAFCKHWFWGYRRLKALWCEWLFQKLLPELIFFILEDISSDSCINLH